MFCLSVVFWFKTLIYICHIHLQGVKIVFKVGLALLKYCHDDLVSFTGSFACSKFKLIV
jgi:hypothetical protein